MTPGRVGTIITHVVTSIALAGAFLMLGAGPASAHYKLNESTPAAGATVEALPEQLTLVFSGPLIDSPVGTAVEVVDASGGSFTSGPAKVDGSTVTQALTGGASGEITVNWKVIFDDGHPVSDSYTFTVAAPAASQSPVASPSDATSAPEQSPDVPKAGTTSGGQDADAPDSATSGGDESGTPWIPIVLGLAVVGVIGALVANRLRGSRPASE